MPVKVVEHVAERSMIVTSFDKLARLRLNAPLDNLDLEPDHSS